MVFHCATGFMWLRKCYRGKISHGLSLYCTRDGYKINGTHDTATEMEMGMAVPSCTS